jgi:hypothetical protein
MVERGELHAALRDEDSRSWGATLEGGTVIRRSAVGLDESNGRLFIGISNDTTARAMAQAMRHVGASDVAQLDVNFSYPKILVFPYRADGSREARSLFRGFLFHADDYVRRPSTRDFFYVERH